MMEPTSKSGKDHWEELLEPLLERDQALCNSWNDEVEHILIFAGLFSGVITSFIMQSYPTLQADPNDTIISILAHIATRLDNLNESSFPSLQPTAPSPVGPSMIITNALWFVSLVLSISTALVGIVALQWIREHQKYPQSLSPRERFAIYNMRAEGLNKWYMPEILSSLPVLLQLSLILFLVGLVVFITDFELYISCPVIVAISLPLIFLIFTSTLPALQGISLCLPISGKNLNIPVQCPYKSPQSEAVRSLISAYSGIFSLLIWTMTGFHFIYVAFITLFSTIFKKGVNRSLASRSHPELLEKEEKEDSRHTILSTWKKRDWVDFDREWVLIRDAYAKSLYQDNRWICSSGAIQYSRMTGPWYDLASGIRYLAVKNPQSPIQETAYSCVRELGEAVVAFQRPGYEYYLQSLLGTGLPDNSFASFSRLIKHEPGELISPQLLSDEISFIFLSSCRSPLPLLARQFKHLHAQLVSHLSLNHDHKAPVGSQNPPKYPDHQLSIVYSKTRSAVKSSKKPLDVMVVNSDKTSELMSSVIKSFFDNITDESIDDDMFFSSFVASPLAFSSILQFAMGQQSVDAMKSTTQHLTQRLSIRDSKKEVNKRSDFLFHAAAFYARSLLLPDDLLFSLQKSLSLHPALGQQGNEETVKWRTDVPAITDFLPVLRSYLKERGEGLNELYLFPPRSDNWWDFLKERGSRRTPNDPTISTVRTDAITGSNIEKEVRTVWSSTTLKGEDDKMLDVA